jgi:hypothetical protein
MPSAAGSVRLTSMNIIGHEICEYTIKIETPITIKLHPQQTSGDVLFMYQNSVRELDIRDLMWLDDFRGFRIPSRVEPREVQYEASRDLPSMASGYITPCQEAGQVRLETDSN